MNVPVGIHESALLSCYTFHSIVVAPLDQFFYHLKLDVNNFCKLNTNKREACPVKTLALLSSPPHLLCMQASLSSRAFLTAAPLLSQGPSKCVILDPVLSLEGHINGGMRNTQHRAAGEHGTHPCFCLICKNGKEPFCPRGFVFSRWLCFRGEIWNKNRGIWL